MSLPFRTRLFRSKLFRFILWCAGIFVVVLFILDTFVMPWYVNKGGTLLVPNVVGLKQEQAFDTLSKHQLEPKLGETRTDDKFPVGTVVQQNPAAGQTVKLGRRIYLAISGGEQETIVPSLRGRTIRDSKFALDRNSLKQGRIRYETSPELPEGTIVSQDIPPGVKVKRGTYISITVSAGQSIDSIYVPSLVGKTLTEARRIIKEKGLKVGNITYQANNELLPNTIIDQLPRENDVVTTDKEIDLFVSQTVDKNVPIRED